MASPTECAPSLRKLLTRLDRLHDDYDVALTFGDRRKCASVLADIQKATREIDAWLQAQSDEPPVETGDGGIE